MHGVCSQIFALIRSGCIVLGIAGYIQSAEYTEVYSNGTVHLP